jgi:hypothetical protein
MPAELLPGSRVAATTCRAAPFTNRSRHHVGMTEPYNRFTGQSIERLTALSDGLFAVAMTLLVLDLRVPVSAAGSVYSERGLGGALLKLGPSFATYLLSFTMLGRYVACPAHSAGHSRSL